jgi:hypothetical protein
MCAFLFFIDKSIVKFAWSVYYISNICPKTDAKIYDVQQCVMFRQCGVNLITGKTA